MVEEIPATFTEALPDLKSMTTERTAAGTVLPAPTPSADYRRTLMPEAKKLRQGLELLLFRQVGRFRSRSANRVKWKREAEAALQRQEVLAAFSDSMLRDEVKRVREVCVRRGEEADKVAAEALALVSEMAVRTLGLRPYLEQITGAIGLREGFLVEMATGEGKTLTLGLAAAVAAWRGLPCHIVTANDYLAERDAENLREFYRGCRLTAGHVLSTQDPTQRTRNYRADIVYTTSKELVADFLRDRLQWNILQHGERRAIRALLNPRVLSPPGIVQRGFSTVLVDEADNILIDEAVTPLIISRPKDNPMLAAATREASLLASELVRGEHYRVDQRYRHIELNEKSWEDKAESWDGKVPILQNSRWRKDLVLKALNAREFFERDKNYIIREKKIVIVDESTGRLMPDRSWRQGLHQAIEVKEGLEMTPPSETLASISFQRFFRQIPNLAGVTGTALENAGEFWRIYELPVVAIATHRPCLRKMEKEHVFMSQSEKLEALVREVEHWHEEAQPVLIGTRNVSSSQRLADMLEEKKIPYQLLNAVHHEKEATIISQAGEFGRVTIATNMAGRGTDICLRNGVAERGGLRVIATERHESRRIDRQLFGRGARQGDPGSAAAFMSLEDEVLVRFVPRAFRLPCIALVRAKMPGSGILARACLRFAQRKATRHNYRQRLSVLRHDRWLDESLSFSSGSRLGQGGG